MPRSVKCFEANKEDSVDLESWTGKDGTPVCSVPANPDLKHVVRVTNWRRKTIEVRIDGEALNSRAIFDSTNNSSWNKTMVIAGRQNKVGKAGYAREPLTSKSSEKGEEETIKTKITYWNKYNQKKVEENKEVSFDVDLT